ncbi:MAG TPA: response regulator, partial [Myxococcota bacterium]
MLLGGRVLVVDDAPFMLEVLGEILRPHFTHVLTASTYREALEVIEQGSVIDVIISDVILPDGNGFKLLEKVYNAPAPKPEVLLITARWEEADSRRAEELGALGYLRKPISIRELRTCLAAAPEIQVRKARQRTLARIWVVDPERRERLLSFEIHDISETGTLLDTTGPLPVGTSLEFEIVYGKDEVIRGRGKIVRVQEPSWLSASGSALRFEWIEAPEKLSRL